MKYVWICMLVVFDVVWLISSIVDIVFTVRYVKNYRWYSNVGDFIDCIIEELEAFTIGFIVFHLFILFFGSFILWTRG